MQEKETTPMRKFAVVLAIGIAGAAFGQMKPVTPNPIQITTGTQPLQQGEAPLESAKRIERNEAIKLVKSGKAIWLDVRGKEQFDAGHIKGAYNLPLTEVVARLKELPPKKQIITYCA
jgi:3-mercaptopyruvate sulfurtransferase SseA